jgi:hypothetical protein
MSEELKSGVGVLQSWQDKPTGWTDFSVLFTGRQHPTKVSTNDQELVAAVKEIGQTVATFTFAEVEGNMNPRTNQPFLNRYLREVVAGATEGVGAPPPHVANSGSTTTSPAGGSPDAKPQEQWEPPPRYSDEEVARFEAKERRDYRSRSWAHTISAWNHTIKVDEDPIAVYERLKPFQRKVYEDICGTFAYDAADDDIPF